MKIKLITALLATCAFAGHADALSVSYIQRFGAATPAWNATFALPQFDPSLGTLTRVTAAVYGEISGTSYIESLLDHAVQESAGNRGLVDLTVPDVAFLGAFPVYQGPLLPVAAFDGIRDFTGADTISYTGSGYDSSSAAPSSFSSYIGTGVFSTTLSISATLPEGYLQSIGNTGMPNFALFNTDLISAGASITYTYDAPVTPPTGGVPEPASWAMLIAGFGLTGAALRLSGRRREPTAVTG